jgi:hypothetical protein
MWFSNVRSSGVDSSVTDLEEKGEGRSVVDREIEMET